VGQTMGQGRIGPGGGIFGPRTGLDWGADGGDTLQSWSMTGANGPLPQLGGWGRSRRQDRRKEGGGKEFEDPLPLIKCLFILY
jgi:hypothetical protein